ncbi:DEAD/DEAH box helicase [Archaeoglobus neptunius]|uniref:DEAD/DEAH box helicase n=1 Tax=Archaeoglobus neptunius TaxID=2798580 RepID=UPI00192935D8|nr:DEAD/DEAH box helicase family protein [Archaeoglobus neptunius]
MERENETVAEKVDRIIEELRSLKDLLEADHGPVVPFDGEEFRAFLRKPYLLLPKSRDEYYVIVPRFVDFHVGWLERQTESYNVFVINRYTAWLTELPEDLKLFEEPPHATVDGRYLVTDDIDHFWRRYRRHLSRREGDRIRIKRGHEFELIASLIEDGILPFKPQPVDGEDLREWEGITLRGYQRRAWEEFLRRGSVGIFWPPGAGKSYFGVYILARVRGKKLVVVPTRTLKEQWERRVRETIPEYEEEVDVMTYASFHRAARREYVLVIFDEVHHLPAPTYVRLSTLKRKYTVGLSASPYREDGKEAYIFALTGFPVGMDWSEFVERGVISKPVFRVKVVRNEREKLKELEKLVGEGKRTIIFCDYISLGKKIAKRLNVPFVYSRTRRRMETITSNRVVVLSRVGDEGISLPDMERVVEVAFLGRSRRQQTQRFGRLLHSTRSVDHILLMTEEEFGKFYPRVYAVEEKGFKVVVERR